KSPQFITI
ncbi:unnamed protein product, partial [Callosobruchus maculatus]